MHFYYRAASSAKASDYIGACLGQGFSVLSTKHRYDCRLSFQPSKCYTWFHWFNQFIASKQRPSASSNCNESLQAYWHFADNIEYPWFRVTGLKE